MSEMMQVGPMTANGDSVATEPAGANDAGTERARERRLRREARRLGFVLNKRRGGVANRNGPNYMLVDAHRGTVVLHDGGCYWNRVTLDDVEAYLDKAEEMANKFDWDKALGLTPGPRRE